MGMPTPIQLITPSEFYILLSLLKGERHGYEIMQQVTEDSEGRIRLGPGTLYGSIKRMLEEKWIEEARRADGDTRRRYYRATRKGKAMVAAELDRYRSAINLARASKFLTSVA